MKTRLFLLFTLIILSSCTIENISQEPNEEIDNNLVQKSGLNNEESLLWNDGITKRSWLFLNQDNGKPYKNLSNYWDAELVGNPANNPNNVNEYTFYDGVTNQPFSFPGMRSPSFKWVTYGYDYSYWGKYSGFDIWIFDHLADGSPASFNDPLEFRIMNHARGMNDLSSPIESARKLREVGFVFDNWPQYWPSESLWTGGYHSFKANYRVNQFSDIRLTFDAKMEAYRKPFDTNNTDPQQYNLGGYATADFRFIQHDGNGGIIKSYLIGILFANPQNIDHNYNPNDNIIYEDNNSQTHVILLDGRKLGISCIDNISDINTAQSNVDETYYLDIYKTVTINYFDLIQQYFPNVNYTNTIIKGLDIYAATRGSDIAFSIKNIQLKGIN